jgi:multiple sugar transport system ATP-binding protein
VQTAASVLGLSGLLDRLPRQLSGGQRQRVAMGRALVRDTKVFLFDEPLSNLDAKLRVQMRVEIRALHRRMGVTSIYVTHDQIEAMTLADRVVVMREGHVEQIGAPLEIYDDPANVFVAEFLGAPAMNLLPAQIRGGRAVLADGCSLPLPDRMREGAADGRPILYGIRPQDLVPSGAEGILAPIDVVEPTGAETLVPRLDRGGPSLCMAVRQVALPPGSPIRSCRAPIGPEFRCRLGDAPVTGTIPSISPADGAGHGSSRGIGRRLRRLCQAWGSGRGARRDQRGRTAADLHGPRPVSLRG